MAELSEEAEAFEKWVWGSVGVGGVTKVVGGSTVFGGVEGTVVMIVGLRGSDWGVVGRGEDTVGSLCSKSRSGKASCVSVGASVTDFFLGKVKAPLNLSTGDVFCRSVLAEDDTEEVDLSGDAGPASGASRLGMSSGKGLLVAAALMSGEERVK